MNLSEVGLTPMQTTIHNPGSDVFEQNRERIPYHLNRVSAARLPRLIAAGRVKEEGDGFVWLLGEGDSLMQRQDGSFMISLKEFKIH